MATTQDGRLLAVYTPLGKDFLMINRISATEGLSQLFEFRLELVHEEDEADYTPTSVDPTELLFKPVTVTVGQRDGTVREFTGIMNSFTAMERDTRFSYYYCTVVPHVWLLTQNQNSRIFQHQSVPEILEEIFSDFEVSFQIQNITNKRNYCVQYRESDFDFACRLMEEEGIFYYFEHSDGKHKMVVGNTVQSHPELPSKSTISYYIDVTRQREDFVTSVHSFDWQSRIVPGKYTCWDYNFQLPTRHLDRSQTSGHSVGDNTKLEIYDYPGGYAKRFDGIDRGGGEQSSELAHADSDDKDQSSQTGIGRFDAGAQTARGVSDCSSLTPGYRFTLENHPLSEYNGGFVVTSVVHEAEQNPTYVTDDVVEEPYTNSFECMSYGTGAPVFRPPLTIPKPTIPGAQTAFVVGPGGEEIFTDKYGRVKVQFHWDREGGADSNSSCWVRVAQSWAGNRWGSMFIPRIGMEVLVHFIDGDPDQPIITGCVYNPQTMPAYTLPDEKTKSWIKSDSSTGGNGFNEFRFEDKAGKEQIFVHGQKDLDVRILNDAKELIKNDRHLIVENNQHEKVNTDKHLHVLGNHNEKIGNNMSVDAGMNIDTKAGMNYAVDAGMAVHIKGGMNVVVEAGTMLTLKVGGNFVNINSGGIFISGTMVMINSGGAAGAGSGCNPTAPTDPQEADDAEAGGAAPSVAASPPPAPPNFTPLGKVLVAASSSGSPFCNIS